MFGLGMKGAGYTLGRAFMLPILNQAAISLKDFNDVQLPIAPASMPGGFIWRTQIA